MFSHPCIDPLDPKGAEIALLCPAVAVRVLQPLFIGILGNRPDILPAPKLAFDPFQDFFPAGS